MTEEWQEVDVCVSHFVTNLNDVKNDKENIQTYNLNHTKFWGKPDIFSGNKIWLGLHNTPPPPAPSSPPVPNCASEPHLCDLR